MVRESRARFGPVLGRPPARADPRRMIYSDYPTDRNRAETRDFCSRCGETAFSLITGTRGQKYR